jgi:thymidine kinase
MSFTNNKYGTLELIIGPMYAGKSTELIRIINRYKYLKKSILIINHSFNNRYNSTNLTTHNKEEIKNCIIVSKLEDIEKNYKDIFDNVDVIVIEELQFFEDAFYYITKWCDNDGKYLICAGLDGDFERKQFGDVVKLIPHAEKITKLTALCEKCGDGTPAVFSKRIIDNIDTTLVGSSEYYIACCRKHYNED